MSDDNRKKCCRTCRHWQATPPVQPSWQATPSEEFRFCAIQAWCENWQGRYRAFMTRADSRCVQQWEKKTNQLYLFS